MAIEKAREHLAKFGMADKIMEFSVSSATVPLAAKAVNCEEARIAKTLSFTVDQRPILIVTAGDAKIDNAKYKAFFKAKAKMLTPDEAVSMIGHEVGGVCPFGINEGVTVYCDVSLKRFTTVFPACGSGNSAIELTPEELYEFSGSVSWVEVCRLEMGGESRETGVWSRSELCSSVFQDLKA